MQNLKLTMNNARFGSIGDSGFFDIHKIFQTPVLFGVAEIELDLEAQAVEFDDLFIR